MNLGVAARTRSLRIARTSGTCKFLECSPAPRRRARRKSRIRLPGHARRRRGAAVVETAVVLPALVILVFAAIEASNAIFLRQTLTVAAHEAASISTRRGGTGAVARLRAEEILQSRAVTGYEISFDPATPETTESGTVITVTITAPADSVVLGPLRLYEGKSLQGRVLMVRL